MSIRLPLDCSTEQLIDAINQVQERCRTGLILRPRDLVHHVNLQIRALNQVADRLGCTATDLCPSAQWWEGSPSGSAQTIVELHTHYIEVHRRGQTLGRRNGELHLVVRSPQ